jgi:NAD-specific glutamate dehydrogenase
MKVKMNNKTKTEVEVKCNGWRCDGAVLNPVEGSLYDLTSLIKDKNTTKITVIVERDEPKNIQMTESDFEELINVVRTWASPVAELKSRLKHGKYRVKGLPNEYVTEHPKQKELEDEIISKFAPKPLSVRQSFSIFLADCKARLSK